MSIKNTDALYYPYIHIRDLDWLKRHLLLFPRVCRIVPLGFAPREAHSVKEYATTQGIRGPLLDRANLFTPGVLDAQRRLYQQLEQKIQSDPERMERQFGFDATVQVRQREPVGFQIRFDKAPELADLLVKHRLAWKPRFLEPDDPAGYVEVHPNIGEAVMTTLAIACAEDEGLQVVTDNRRLHRCLAEHDLENVFETWVEGATAPAQDLADARAYRLSIAVFESMDVSKVSPRAIVDLQKEWEARRVFLEKIRGLAETIPDMKKCRSRAGALQSTCH
jgi:hypothetical protein